MHNYKVGDQFVCKRGTMSDTGGDGGGAGWRLGEKYTIRSITTATWNRKKDILWIVDSSKGVYASWANPVPTFIIPEELFSM